MTGDNKMKNIFLAVLMITAASTSQAATQNEKEQYCIDIKEKASLIMQSRLLGANVVRMMRIAGNDPVLIAMTNDAYSSFGYSTDEYKQKAIQEFSAKYYIDCMKKAK